MKKLFLTVSVFTVALTGFSYVNAATAKEEAPTVKASKKATPACPVPVHHKAHIPQPPVKKEVVAKKAPSKKLGLEISGETSVNYYLFENKQREPNRGKGRGTHLAVDDSRINFEVFGKATECLGGLEYSFLIGISGNAVTEENPVEENRIKLKGEWGTFIAGDTRGPTDFMAVGTFYFLGATGGIFGNYKEVANDTTGVIIRDDLLNRFTPKDQTKMIYITPRIYGVQLGYGYTPDGAHKGDQNLFSHTPTTAGVSSIGRGGARFSGANFHEAAINYKDSYLTCIDVSLSATGILGKMRNIHRSLEGVTDINQFYNPWGRRYMKAFALGAVVEYAGFSVGGEFLNNLKSGQLKVLQGANLGKVYSAGIGYKKDCDEVSFAYLHSKRNLGRLTTGPIIADFGNVKADNFSLTYDHEVAPGLAAYAEGIAFRMRASQPGNLATWNTAVNGFRDDTVGPNRGQVFITGARIKF